MSFFDEGEQPTRVSRPARPRRTSGPTGGARSMSGGRGGGGSGASDPEVRRRQLIAAGIGLLVLLVLIFGIRACASNAKDRALKDYNRDVTAIATSSNDQVAKPFFDLLDGGGEANELQVQVNQLRLEAEDEAGRAKALDPPDALRRAHGALLLALHLRAGALNKIADELPGAQSRGRGASAAAADSVRKIAGQMQALLASDVVYSQRVVPYIGQALSDAGVGGQRITPSRFLGDRLQWLDPDTVAQALDAPAGGSGDTNGGAAKPGPHGHGLTSVRVGQAALQPSPQNNRIPAGAGLAFTVQFANQGNSDESQVKVNLRIGNAKPISKTLDVTKAGSPAEVSIPVANTPPIGTPVSVAVEIAKVRGEMKTDNNRQRYTVTFTR
jgi:hypothetical protein